MNPQLIDFLYKGSIALIIFVVVATLLSATGLYDFGDYEMVHLVYLATVLWFVLWQVKRNK